jgi:AraC-like DNA-binding protein
MSVELQTFGTHLQPSADDSLDRGHFLSNEPSSAKPYTASEKQTMNEFQMRVEGPQTPRRSMKGSVQVWRPWQIKQLELCHGIAVSTPSIPHFAQEYMLVSMQSGTANIQYRNTRTGGQVIDETLFVIEPGEVWSCQSEELSFSHVLIDPTLLQQFASELFQSEQSLPHFPRHAIFDPSLGKILRHLASSSLAPVSRLQQEEMLLHLSTRLLLSHTQKTRALPRIGRENPAIKRTKEYLEAHYAEEVTLQELSHVANLSPFHLTRVFRQTVGLPPHAYQTQLRLLHARTLLTQGFPVGHVAAETGFFDQSHFTQQFQRHFLVTPGRYSKTARFS